MPHSVSVRICPFFNFHFNIQNLYMNEDVNLFLDLLYISARNRFPILPFKHMKHVKWPYKWLKTWWFYLGAHLNVQIVHFTYYQRNVFVYLFFLSACNFVSGRFQDNYLDTIKFCILQKPAYNPVPLINVHRWGAFLKICFLFFKLPQCVKCSFIKRNHHEFYTWSSIYLS